MKKFKILSVCGSGIATSTLVSEKLKTCLTDRGITQMEIQECNISEVNGMIHGFNPDIVIATTSLNSIDLGNIPGFSGMPILMNMNVDALMDQIVNTLKEKQ